MDQNEHPQWKNIQLTQVISRTNAKYAGRCQNETPNIQTFKRTHPEHATHTGEKRFKCEISKKDFVAPPSTHMTSHNRKKPFFYLECKTNSTYTSNLHRHMRIHTDEKPFSCPKCNRSFTHECNLLTHMRIHIGEEPFSCSKRGMNFTDQLSRLRHHIDEKPCTLFSV
ncbi:gastrula zinc finger protein XlCGF71.1 [Loa loa]|uniref:Gastrula zinc finger protein XlCGF71.1 n=1 Tax=Loa loa TaxID=7209 RepID=A0A1I7V9D5_LOALO|nr:gastrula zinc finger protein XlCGF71.1 [Loa loa]EFO18478.1 gastrula zinc finger protein XlCGF71.1 [Loa loa]